MNILDTHQHLWDLTRFRYGWCQGIPALERSFTIDDYTRAATGTGITQSILVEADVDERFISSETQWALTLARDTSQSSVVIAGIVAAVRPESQDFPEQIEPLLGHDLLKGVRRILHTQPDDLSTRATFRENVRRLGDYGLSFDICVLEHQLPVAIELVDSCPEVSFILDHAGNPPLDDGRLRTWGFNMRRLAERTNVACKISGLLPRAGVLPPREHFQRIVNNVIDCFGWDRVMFGSDWPLCTLTSSLGGWVELEHDLTREFGAENQCKLFRRNAERIYRCSGDNQ